MMRKISIICLVLAFISCNPAKKAEKEQQATDVKSPQYELELVWSSDTLLRTPESVLFDKDRNILYVSNINLDPWEKDGNGFISRMNPSGEIVDLKWVEGLSGPKGMGLFGSSLYVADIDEIVQIDIEAATISGRFKVEGKPDLNDITVGEDGTVYVTGSTSNTIYALKDGNITEFLSGGDERFNGLLWEKDRLLLLTSGSGLFKAIDWNTKAVSIIAKNMGHGDAIVAVGDGSYLTSDWDGAVYHVSPEGETTTLLDTKESNENAADFGYSMEDHLLFIPTFNANRVKAYRLTF